MKKRIVLLLLVVLTAAATFAQKLEKPSLNPKADTPAQQQVIRDGTKFHDLKQYDEAIKRYETVLVENPDSTLALYELAMSQYTKGEKQKALDTALRGSKYRSSELPLFYMVIGNVMDDLGKPDDAVRLYKDAIAILNADKGLSAHVAEVHYNLAVTYFRQKKYPEAREGAKKAVEHNFSYPSPHYLLAIVYNGTKYKVPAFMAAARLVSLEVNTGRTAPAAKIMHGILEAKKDEKTGNINIIMDINAPKDEGDFAMYDLILGTLTTIKDEKDAGKSSEEIFADAVDSTIGFLADDKKLRSTFVGKNYVPFLVALKAQGHSRTLAYQVLSKSGNAVAAKWVTANAEKLRSLEVWAKAYQPTAR